jgi:hypothetical protein
VPGVVATRFDLAVGRLLRHHLLVAVHRFAPFHDAMAEQGFGRLENYRVVAQSVPPGRRLAAGATVSLTLDTPVFRGPLGSVAEPVRHPRYARVPNLVGEEYRQAMAAPRATGGGILVRLSRTGPLTPGAGACGLNGLVVSSQRPRPGTRVRWGGTMPDGVKPSLATVTVTLASRPLA